MDPKIIFPFAVNNDRSKIIKFTSVNKWGYNLHDKDYIDLSLGSCGCFPLGFHRYDFADTVTDRLKEFPHLSGEFLTTNEFVIELAERLYELSEGYRSIFTTSGSDAVETAIKVARQLQGKDKKILLGFENSYHGSTYLSQSIGGVQNMHQIYGRDENCYSLPWDLNEAETVIKNLLPLGICCVIVETCSWYNGLYPCSDDWWLELRKLCTKYDIILIVDDIAFCGGKTGSFFGFNRIAEPDIVCIGKALTGGYYPLAGCLIRDTVYDVLKKDTFLHGFSYSFSMSGIVSALHYLDVIEKEKTLNDYDAIRIRAEQLFDKMQKFQCVSEIRNFGLTWCLDISSTSIDNNLDLFNLFMDNGLYLGLWNSHNNLLIALPNILDEEYFLKLESRLSSALNSI